MLINGERVNRGGGKVANMVFRNVLTTRRRQEEGKIRERKTRKEGGQMLELMRESRCKGNCAQDSQASRDPKILLLHVREM